MMHSHPLLAANDSTKIVVLILVVMDDALALDYPLLIVEFIFCLNPCCNG